MSTTIQTGSRSYSVIPATSGMVSSLLVAIPIPGVDPLPVPAAVTDGADAA
jgi:hypothetical protein